VDGIGRFFGGRKKWREGRKEGGRKERERELTSKVRRFARGVLCSLRWWSVFWELFTATGGPEQQRNNVVPQSMDAVLYVQVSSILLLFVSRTSFTRD